MWAELKGYRALLQRRSVVLLRGTAGSAAECVFRDNTSSLTNFRRPLREGSKIEQRVRELRRD